MPVSNSEKSRAIKKLDIRGKVCPMTFVYTKLTLEKMDPGEILEVTLDFPAAVKNVPVSVKRQKLGDILGIEILNTEKKTWNLTIKKI